MAETGPGRFVVRSAELETVCGVKSGFPDSRYPEAAFAGRSNVGKSSLINAVVNRKSLARTSSSPGKTRTINFYNINGSLYLVDLPGYGYTDAAPAARAEWGRMVERYLRRGGMLKKIFLLVDMRHAPSSDDRMMYDWISGEGIEPVVVATKSDKLKKSEKPAALRLIRDSLGMSEGERLIPFSAVTKDGREEIYEVLEEMING